MPTWRSSSIGIEHLQGVVESSVPLIDADADINVAKVQQDHRHEQCQAERFSSDVQ